MQNTSQKPSPWGRAQQWLHGRWSHWRQDPVAWATLTVLTLATTLFIVRCEGENNTGPKSLLGSRAAHTRVLASQDLEGGPRFASYKQLPHIFLQKPMKQEIPIAQRQVLCPQDGSAAPAGQQQTGFALNVCVFDDADETYLDSFLTGEGVALAKGRFPPMYISDAQRNFTGGWLQYRQQNLSIGGQSGAGAVETQRSACVPPSENMSCSDLSDGQTQSLAWQIFTKPRDTKANQCLYFNGAAKTPVCIGGAGIDGVDDADDDPTNGCQAPSPYPHQCPESIKLDYAHSHVFDAAKFFDEFDVNELRRMSVTAYSENARIFSVLLDTVQQRITLIPRHVGVSQLVLKATPAGVGEKPHLRKIQIGVVPFQQARVRVHPRDTATMPTPDAGSGFAWEALLQGPEKMLRGNVAEYKMLAHEGKPSGNSQARDGFNSELRGYFCPSAQEAPESQGGGEEGGQQSQAAKPRCTGHYAGFFPVYTFWNDAPGGHWFYRQVAATARAYGAVVADLIEGYIGVYAQPQALRSQNKQALSSKFVVIDERGPRSRQQGVQVVSYRDTSGGEAFTCPTGAVCWASRNDLRLEGCGDSDFCLFATPNPRECLQQGGGSVTCPVSTSSITDENTSPVIRPASHSLAYTVPQGIVPNHTMNIFIPSDDEDEEAPARPVADPNDPSYMTLYVGFEPQGYTPDSVVAQSIKRGVASAERPFVPVKIYDDWSQLFKATACTFDNNVSPVGAGNQVRDGECGAPVNGRPDPDCCQPPASLRYAGLDVNVEQAQDPDSRVNRVGGLQNDFRGALHNAWKCMDSRAREGASDASGDEAALHECVDLQVMERGAAGAAVWCLPKAVAVASDGDTETSLHLSTYVMYGHQGLGLRFNQPALCPQACQEAGGPCLQQVDGVSRESIRHFADSFTLRVTDGFYNVKDLKVRLKTLEGVKDGSTLDQARRILVGLASSTGAVARQPAGGTGGSSGGAGAGGGAQAALPVLEVSENIGRPLKVTLSSPFASDVRVRWGVSTEGIAEAARAEKCDGGESSSFEDAIRRAISGNSNSGAACDFYAAEGGFVNISAGQTEVPLPVSIYDDSVVEATESFKISISGLECKNDQGSFTSECSGVGLHNTGFQVQIQDDDRSSISVEIAGVVSAGQSCQDLCAQGSQGVSLFVPTNSGAQCRRYSGAVDQGDRVCLKINLSQTIQNELRLKWQTAGVSSGGAVAARAGSATDTRRDYQCAISQLEGTSCSHTPPAAPVRGLGGEILFSKSSGVDRYLALDTVVTSSGRVGSEKKFKFTLQLPENVQGQVQLAQSVQEVSIKKVVKVYIAKQCSTGAIDTSKLVSGLQFREEDALNTLKVCVSGGLSGAFTLYAHTQAGRGPNGATAGDDFRAFAPPKELRFAASSTRQEKDILLNLIDDSLAEGVEYFNIVLSPSRGGGSVRDLSDGGSSTAALFGALAGARLPSGLSLVESTRIEITDAEPAAIRMALVAPRADGQCPTQGTMQAIEANTIVEGQNACVKVFLTEASDSAASFRLAVGASSNLRDGASPKIVSENFKAEDCAANNLIDCDFSLQGAEKFTGTSGSPKTTSTLDISLGGEVSEPTTVAEALDTLLGPPVPPCDSVPVGATECVATLETHFDSKYNEGNERLKVFLCSGQGGASCTPSTASASSRVVPNAPPQIDGAWNQRNLTITNDEGAKINIAGPRNVAEGEVLTVRVSLDLPTSRDTLQTRGGYYRGPIGMCWKVEEGTATEGTGTDGDYIGFSENIDRWQPLLAENSFVTWTNGLDDYEHTVRIRALNDNRPEASGELFSLKFRIASLTSGGQVDCETPLSSRGELIGFGMPGMVATAREYTHAVTITDDSIDLNLDLLAQELRIFTDGGYFTSLSPRSCRLHSSLRGGLPVGLLTLGQSSCSVEGGGAAKTGSILASYVGYIPVEADESCSNRCNQSSDIIWTPIISAPKGSCACISVLNRGAPTSVLASILGSRNDYEANYNVFELGLNAPVLYPVKIKHNGESENCKSLRVQFVDRSNAQNITDFTVAITPDADSLVVASGFSETTTVDWKEAGLSWPDPEREILWPDGLIGEKFLSMSQQHINRASTENNKSLCKIASEVDSQGNCQNFPLLVRLQHNPYNPVNMSYRSPCGEGSDDGDKCTRLNVPVCKNLAAWEDEKKRRAEEALGPMIKVTHLEEADDLPACVAHTANELTDIQANVTEGKVACATVKLTKPVSHPVSVNWSVFNLSASSGDYDLREARPRNPQTVKWTCVPTLGDTQACADAGGARVSATATQPATCNCDRPAALYKTIALKIQNDGSNDDECTEDLNIALGPVVDGAGLVKVSENQKTARITIPSGPGGPSNLAKVSLDCDDTVPTGVAAKCRVTLDKAIAYTTNVRLQTVDGTAISGRDYDAKVVGLSIPNGATSVGTTIPTKLNAKHQSTFKVKLLTADLGGVDGCIGLNNVPKPQDSDGKAIEETITIITPPPKVQVAQSLSVDEADGSASLGITLSRAYIEPITVEYRTLATEGRLDGVNEAISGSCTGCDGGAEGTWTPNDADYNSVAQWRELSIEKGRAEKSILFHINNDNLIEPDEVFDVEIRLKAGAPTGVELARAGSSTASATSDDPPASVTRTITIEDDDSGRLTLALVGYVNSSSDCYTAPPTQPVASRTPPTNPPVPTFTNLARCSDGSSGQADCTGDKVWYLAGSGVDANKDGEFEQNEIENFEIPEGKSVCFKVSLGSTPAPQDIVARWMVRDGTATNEDYDVPDAAAVRTVTIKKDTHDAYFAIDIPPSSDNNNECDESFEVVLSNQVGDLGTSWPTNLQFNPNTDGKARVNIEGQDNLIQVSLNCGASNYLVTKGRVFSRCASVPVNGDEYYHPSVSDEATCTQGRGSWRASRSASNKCKCLTVRSGQRYLSFPSNQNRCLLSSNFVDPTQGPGFDQPINVEWEFREGSATRGDFQARGGQGTFPAGSSSQIMIPLQLTPGATTGEHFFLELTRAWRQGDNPTKSKCVQVAQNISETDLNKIKNDITESWSDNSCPLGDALTHTTGLKQPLCIAPEPEPIESAVGVELAGYVAPTGSCATDADRSDVPPEGITEGQHACFKIQLTQAASQRVVAKWALRLTTDPDDVSDYGTPVGSAGINVTAKTVEWAPENKEPQWLKIPILSSDTQESCDEVLALTLAEDPSSQFPEGVGLSVVSSVAELKIKPDSGKATISIVDVSEALDPLAPSAGHRAVFEARLSKSVERSTYFGWRTRHKTSTNVDLTPRNVSRVVFAGGETEKQLRVPISSRAVTGHDFYAQFLPDTLDAACIQNVTVAERPEAEASQRNCLDADTTNDPAGGCHIAKATIKDPDDAVVELALVGYTDTAGDCSAAGFPDSFTSNASNKCPLVPVSPTPASKCWIDDSNRDVATIPEGKHACFKASLSKEVASGVQVAYDFVTGTARTDDYAEPTDKTIRFCGSQLQGSKCSESGGTLSGATCTCGAGPTSAAQAQYVAVEIKSDDATEYCDDDFSLRLKALAASPLPEGVIIAGAAALARGSLTSTARAVIAANAPKAKVTLTHVSEAPQPHAGGQARFRVGLTQQVERVVRMPWETRNGTGTAGATAIDYAAYSKGAVSFAVGEVSREFSVSIGANARAGKWFFARFDTDQIDNATKMCIDLQGISGKPETDLRRDIEISSAVGETCVDDNSGNDNRLCGTNIAAIKKTPLTATIASRRVAVPECEDDRDCSTNKMQAEVRVTLSAVPQEHVKITYQTQDVAKNDRPENTENAAASTDYEAVTTAQLLTWGVRDTELTKNILIDINNDSTLEQDEVFEVRLEVTHGTVKFDTEADDKTRDKVLVVIEDDDAARMSLELVGYTDSEAACTGVPRVFSTLPHCSGDTTITTPAACTGDRVFYAAGRGVDADNNGTITDKERDNFGAIPEGKHACFKASLDKEVNQQLTGAWQAVDGTATNEDYDLPDTSGAENPQLITFAANEQTKYFSIHIPSSGSTQNECQEHFDVSLSKELGRGNTWPTRLAIDSDKSTARVRIAGIDALVKVSLNCAPYSVGAGTSRIRCTGGYSSLPEDSQQCEDARGFWDESRSVSKCKCLGKASGNEPYNRHALVRPSENRYLVYPADNQCLVVMSMKDSGGTYRPGRGFDQNVEVEWEFREGTATSGDISVGRGKGSILSGSVGRIPIQISRLPGAVQGEYFYIDLLRAYRDGDEPTSGCVKLDTASLVSTSDPDGVGGPITEGFLAEVTDFRTAWEATNCGSAAPAPSGQITAALTGATKHKQPLCIAPPPANTEGGSEQEDAEISLVLAGYAASAAVCASSIDSTSTICSTTAAIASGTTCRIDTSTAEKAAAAENIIASEGLHACYKVTLDQDVSNGEDVKVRYSLRDGTALVISDVGAVAASTGTTGVDTTAKTMTWVGGTAGSKYISIELKSTDDTEHCDEDFSFALVTPTKATDMQGATFTTDKQVARARIAGTSKPSIKLTKVSDPTIYNRQSQAAQMQVSLVDSSDQPMSVERSVSFKWRTRNGAVTSTAANNQDYQEGIGGTGMVPLGHSMAMFSIPIRATARDGKKFDVFFEADSISSQCISNHNVASSFAGLDLKHKSDTLTIRQGGETTGTRISIELAGYVPALGTCNAAAFTTALSCADTPVSPFVACKGEGAAPESAKACFKVKLSRRVSEVVNIGYAISHDSTVNTDIGTITGPRGVGNQDATTTRAGTLRWVANNKDDKYISVELKNDSTAEYCDDSFNLTLQPAGGTALPTGVTIDATKQSAMATIASSNKATLSLTLSEQPYVGGDAIFQAQLSRAVERPVTAGWRVLSGGANAAGPLDYNERASGTVTIPVRTSSPVNFAPVSVYSTATADKEFYAHFVPGSIDKTCVSNVVVQSPTQLVTSTTGAAATACKDSDLSNDPNNCHIAKAKIQARPVILSLASRGPIQIVEGTTQNIRFELSAAVDAAFSMQMGAAADADASTLNAAPADYSILPAVGRVQWAANQSSREISISATDDNAAEGNEHFIVEVTLQPTALLARTAAQGKIQVLDSEGNNVSSSSYKFSIPIEIVDNDRATIEVVDISKKSGSCGAVPANPGPALTRAAEDIATKAVPCDVSSVTTEQVCYAFDATWTAASGDTPGSCARAQTQCGAAVGGTWQAASSSCQCYVSMAERYEQDVAEGEHICIYVKQTASVTSATQAVFNVAPGTANTSDYGSEAFRNNREGTLRWRPNASGTDLYKVIDIPILRNQGTANDECKEDFTFQLASAGLQRGQGTSPVNLGTQREATINIAGNTGTRARVALVCPVFAAPPEESIECGVTLVDHRGTGPAVDNDVIVEWKTFDNTATRGDFESDGSVQTITIARGEPGTDLSTISIPITRGATLGQTFFVGLLRAWRSGDDPDSQCIKVAGGGARERGVTIAGGRREGGNVAAVSGTTESNARCEDTGGHVTQQLLRMQSVALGIETNACREVMVAGGTTVDKEVTLAEGTEKPTKRKIEFNFGGVGSHQLYLIPSRTTLTGTGQSSGSISPKKIKLYDEQPYEAIITTDKDAVDENNGVYNVTFAFSDNASARNSASPPTALFTQANCQGTYRGVWKARNGLPARCENVAPKGVCHLNDEGKCTDKISWPVAPRSWGYLEPLEMQITITDDDECEENMERDACEAATGLTSAFTAGSCSQSQFDETGCAEAPINKLWVTGECWREGWNQAECESAANTATHEWTASGAGVYSGHCKHKTHIDILLCSGAGSNYTWVDNECVMTRKTDKNSCPPSHYRWFPEISRCMVGTSSNRLTTMGQCKENHTWTPSSCACPDVD